MLKKLFKKKEIIKTLDEMPKPISKRYEDIPIDPLQNKLKLYEQAIARNIGKSMFNDKISGDSHAGYRKTVLDNLMTLDSSNGGNIQSYLAQPNVSEGIINWFGSLGFIGYQLCAIIASQHWLIDKACTVPARDAIRNGYNITVNDGNHVDQEKLDKIREYDEQYNINENAVEFCRMARVFGIRIAKFEIDVEDPIEFYANPFNIDAVKPGSYKGISQIDPYWITPELDNDASTNAASMYFYEPTFWRVQGMRIHRTHLIINRPYPMPDILKPNYMYGGISLTQKIYERVYAAERTANEAPMLTMTKRMNILSTDVTAVTANPIPMQNKLLQMARMRDNYGVLLKDVDESYEQVDTNLSDLDAVIMTQYQIVSAIANVPISKLMGITLKGFNNSGEYEEESYHEELRSIQAHEMSPLIQRHHDLIVKSFIEPSNPFSTCIDWRPLNTATDEELANLNKLKAEAGVALASIGAIDGMDERERLINDPASGYNGMESNNDDEDDLDYSKVPSDINDPDDE